MIVITTKSSTSVNARRHFRRTISDFRLRAQDRDLFHDIGHQSAISNLQSRYLHFRFRQA